MITIKESPKTKKEIKCDFCGSVLEYEDSDIHDIYNGWGFSCPSCGNEVTIEEIDYSYPDYPKNFYSFKDGKEISDEEIQEWCKKALEYLKYNAVGESCELGTGDTKVIGHKYEDEITITVAKKYEEYSYFFDENEN